MTLLAFAADRRAAVIRIERRPRLLHTHRAAVDGCYRHANGRKTVL